MLGYRDIPSWTCRLIVFYVSGEKGKCKLNKQSNAVMGKKKTILKWLFYIDSAFWTDLYDNQNNKF